MSLLVSLALKLVRRTRSSTRKFPSLKYKSLHCAPSSTLARRYYLHSDDVLDLPNWRTH